MNPGEGPLGIMKVQRQLKVVASVCAGRVARRTFTHLRRQPLVQREAVSQESL